MIECQLTFNGETIMKMKPAGQRDAHLLKLAIDGQSVKKIVEQADGTYDIILTPTESTK